MLIHWLWRIILVSLRIMFKVTGCLSPRWWFRQSPVERGKKIAKRNLLDKFSSMEIDLGQGLQMRSQKHIPRTKSFLSARQELPRVMDAKDARETQHPSHHLLPHTTFSCATWSVAYTSVVVKQRFVSPKLLKLFTIIR